MTIPPQQNPEPTHSPQELDEAIRHVGYEVQMMAAASKRLAAATSDGDGIAANAFLESMLLHARALIAFFLHDGRKDDIRRTDFAPDWTPLPVPAVANAYEAYPLLNKYLAHLTWQRVSPAAPEWNYPTIAADVASIADYWCRHVADTNHSLAMKFRPYVAVAVMAAWRLPFDTTAATSDLV